MIEYRQEGDLNINTCHFDGTSGGTILIRNPSATPKTLIFLNNIAVSPFPLLYDIEGNWNYQDATGRSIRSLDLPKNMVNNNLAQAVFSNEFNVQALRTYNMRGIIAIARTTGTATHKIGITYEGTSVISSSSVHYSTTTNNVGLNSLSQTYGCLSTSLTTTIFVTPETSDVQEYNTITINGQFRTSTKGTFIPKLIWSAAPGGTSVIQSNSYIELIPEGSSSMISLV